GRGSRQGAPGAGSRAGLRGLLEAALVSAALRAGVAIAPGRPYYCAEPPSAQVRLSFAAVAGAGEITEGVRRLRAACEKLFAASGPHHLSSGHD
ncbi:hypothetical protein ACWCO9_27860, partial [Streptomyces sp. NPDC001937]